jgi:threonine synthase
VPAYTPAAKIVQMRAYGAEIELVPGTRQDTSDEAARQSARIFYASHNWQPFFLQGTKTLAYELWEDLGFRAPDHVVIPTGAGSNVLGCDIGFSELLRSREIDALPRLHAVQPKNCAPFANAFAEGLATCPDVDAKPTIAEGTAIAKPVRPREVLAAIRRSGGSSSGVGEAEIEAACRELALLGLYAEPTAAVAAAGLSQLLEAGTIARDETVVVVLTGGGLKATQRWGEWVGS